MSNNRNADSQNDNEGENENVNEYSNSDYSSTNTKPIPAPTVESKFAQVRKMISIYKAEFISTELNNGLKTFVENAHKELDKYKIQKMQTLQGRSSSNHSRFSILNLFRKNNKIVPEVSVESLKSLPSEQAAEFATAKQLLTDTYNYIVNQQNLNLVTKAIDNVTRQDGESSLFAAIKILKKDRKLDKKILKLLNGVAFDLESYKITIEGFVGRTNYRVEQVASAHIDTAYKKLDAEQTKNKAFKDQSKLEVLLTVLPEASYASFLNNLKADLESYKIPKATMEVRSDQHRNVW